MYDLDIALHTICILENRHGVASMRMLVIFFGQSSVVLAAVVLLLQLLPPIFRDRDMGMVLTINCGVAAVLLLSLHLLLSLVPRWRHRMTLWVLLAWGVMSLVYWQII